MNVIIGHFTDGDSRDNGGMPPTEPPNVEALKTDLREMRRDMRVDFRILFGAIIAVALGLAGLMAKGFHWF